MHHHLLEDFMQAFSILHENGLQNKPVTEKRKGSTLSTHEKNKYPRKQSNYKTSLSPKNILHQNGLQNKPFTKKHSPRKRSTKQTVHQKKLSKNTVYKTSLSPKKSLQNKPFTKKKSPRNRSTKQTVHQKNGLQNKPSTKQNSRKWSTKKALATNVPQENAQHKGLGPKHAEDQTILVICRGCVK